MQVRGGKAASVASDVLPKVLLGDLAEETLACGRASSSRCGRRPAIRHWETIVTAAGDAERALAMTLRSVAADTRRRRPSIASGPTEGRV